MTKIVGIRMTGVRKTPKKVKEKKEISILAVDDTPLSLNLLKVALQTTEYKITCVNSGRLALRFIKRNNPDLFLLDIEMPEMDGYELAKKIKESGQIAPVIFLTASATKGCVKKAAEAGAVDYIVKPIDSRKLLAKIKKYL
ncbi:MAG: response regulator [Treponema sp.]|jgi:CheY-like chemotaxis protein|nr:response regulator [Treponema sp.]